MQKVKVQHWPVAPALADSPQWRMRCGSSRRSSGDQPGCLSRSWRNHPGGGAAMSSRDVGLKPFTPTTSYVLSPGSLTHVKKFTHLCVDVGEVQELVSTFRCRRQSDGEVQEADGEITCRNLSYQNIFYHIFFETDGRRWFIVRVVEMYHTLTVKLNSGPMSSRVLTSVMTGVAASATKKLMFDSLWIRKQGRTKVSCES